MSKYDILPPFECQNRILKCQNTIIGPISNVKIVFFNVKIQHSGRF